MKKMISIFAMSITLVACKNKINEDIPKNMVLVDTTGLSKSNVLTDVGNNKYVLNSAVKEEKKQPVTTTPKKVITTSQSSRVNSVSNAGAAPVKQDKGWSHAARGTAVGAGTGAIFGAIVNKDHRAQGALIGSVIGAGTGYLIGRKTDKNTGRVDRAKARKAAAANQ